ncbi:methyl-accepting chemotaxis protein [Imhoffiella purpurea]|uniref:Methyl-accepting chemotaxis protein clustered to carbohydrate kinase n=1 Tax=Imhoffiella purpurea TaxID=1249627 RepID=W9W1J9_9GAMM|nr:methyl-accepting chemotaxis protein [Imhoffiella purpurea]EXJ16485.1 Methyl-accepting chemotaxis protein clustered to carbohydrate kinase [Imhoffiella purpurea]
MQWLNNLSFRYKLTIPLVLVAALFILFVWSTLFRFDRLVDEVSELVGADIPAVKNLLQTDRDLYQVLTAERTLIFTDASSPEFAAALESHAENIQQARERFDRAAEIILTDRHLDSGNALTTRIADYKERRETWEAMTQRIVEERRSDTRIGRSTAINLTLKEGVTSFEAMRSILDELEDMVIGLADASSMRAESSVSESRMQTIVLAVIVIGILAAVVFGLPPLVIKPLSHVLVRIQDIAEGEGDLRARLDQKGRDEIGQIAGALNKLLERLQQLVSQSAGSARQLDHAVERLKTVAAQSDEAMMEQLSQIQMVATAMHQMSATVNEVAANTNHAAESARTADTGVRSGAKVVGEASVAIGQLAEVVSKASEAIATLESETNRIGAVLEVIKGIAEQTSLLALNAAIEAARAGESGRGFAVVASEVRNLASRTQKSTGEIEGMIASLQSSARNVVTVMDSGRGMVDSTLEKAAQASRSLDEITQAVSRINDMNTQIASATEEQSAVTDEVSGNTLRIQNLAEHAVSANQQTAEARGELASLAQSLNAELAQFKV